MLYLIQQSIQMTSWNQNRHFRNGQSKYEVPFTPTRCVAKSKRKTCKWWKEGLKFKLHYISSSFAWSYYVNKVKVSNPDLKLVLRWNNVFSAKVIWRTFSYRPIKKKRKNVRKFSLFSLSNLSPLNVLLDGNYFAKLFRGQTSHMLNHYYFRCQVCLSNKELRGI